MHQFADAGTIFSVRSASLSILFILSRTEYATDALERRSSILMPRAPEMAREQ